MSETMEVVIKELKAINRKISDDKKKKQKSPVSLAWKWWKNNYRECIISIGLCLIAQWVSATFFHTYLFTP